MPFVLRPPGETPPPLTARLADLGRSRRRAAVAIGVFQLAAVVVAAVAVSCALDAAFHLPAAVRVFLLVGTLAAVGILYLCGVRRPAQKSIHPLSVALLLEDTFPRLNDSLASAIEFLTTDEATADRLGSARFRGVAVVRAQNLAGRYDLGQIVPSGLAWRAFWFSVFAGAVVMAVAAANPGPTRTALVRFADPYGRHPWPTRTMIAFLQPAEFPTRLAKGDSFDLKFAVRGEVPERAVVQVRLVGGPQAEDTVPLPMPTDPTTDMVTGELRLDPGRVPRDFEIRIIANDADTSWLAVAVAPPPVLVPLDGRPSPQIQLDFPGYTDLASVELPNGAGVMEAVAATRVTLRAATDRPITAAVVRPQFDLASAHVAVAVAGLAGHGPISALAARLLATEASADVPVRVSGPERNRLEVEFTPRLPGLYALRFTDETGLTGTRLLDLRVFPDPAPTVILRRPDSARDPLTLLPAATVPLVVWAEDRTFAVRDVVLEYRIGGPDAPFRTIPLADFPAAVRAVPAVIGAAPGPVTVKPLGGIDVARSMTLSTFEKSDGTALGDGDILTLRVAATDWDDVAWTKTPGRSREVEIRIVSKTGLEAMLQTELAKLRPELLRVREDQRAAREAVAEVAKAAAAGQVTPEDANKLAQAQQAQRDLANKVGDPNDGLRAQADRLRQVLRSNSLPKSATAGRVEDVADDLGKLAADSLEAANRAIADARTEADKAASVSPRKPDPKKLAETAEKTVREQRAAEEKLNAILERLDQWGGASEVRGQARAIKDQVNRAGADAAKATDKVPAGKQADDLTPRERQELEGPAGKLDEATKQAGDLIDKADRLAGEKDAQAKSLAETAAQKEKQADALTATADQKPRTAEADAAKAEADTLRAEAAGLRKAADVAKAEAAALRQAVREAGGNELPSTLKATADALRENQPGVANARRQDATARLDKLADALSEKKPDDEVDQLQKRRKADATDADKIAEAQDELQKKSREAAEIADPKERSEAMEKLSREQDKLRHKAEQLAERLTREREERAAAAVRKSAERMATARDELEQGKPPAEKQEDALDRLDEALDKLEAEQKQAEEQLTREKREELAEQLKAIRDRQAAAVAEAGRLQSAVVAAKEWSRAQLGSYRDMKDGQKTLADELRKFAEKQLADVPVFQRLATQSADAMNRAYRRGSERVDDTALDAPIELDVEAAADERVRGSMRTALRRLDQIIGSLKDEPKLAVGQQAAAGEQPAGGGEGEGGETGGKPGGIPPLAQLKALRAVQAEVNERTATFAKSHPDADKFNDDDKDELKELEQTQREVAELFDKLSSMFRPGEIP